MLTEAEHRQREAERLAKQKEFNAKIEPFLADLSIISKKHGVVIDGCGCCGSPFLRPFCEEDKTDGKYSQDAGNGDFGWEEK